ncbi:MAG: efflux RND transporter periplasmic adaptor subunit [Planctomycetaceae bacterium]
MGRRASLTAISTELAASVLDWRDKMKSAFISVCLMLPLTIPATVPQQQPTSQPPQRGQRRGVLPIDECRIQLLGSKVLVVGASQTGILEYVEPGEIGKKVVSGRAVAKIRDKVMQEKLAASLKRAESTVEVRYAEAQRAVALQKFNESERKPASYSVAERVNLRLELQKSDLQIEKAKFDAEVQKLEPLEIRAELANYIMTAPIGGEVTQVLKHTGESVRQGDDILEITDTSEVEAIGRVPVRFQNQVTKGTEVLIYILGDSPGDAPPFDQVFKGKITFLSSRVSRVSQEYDIHAVIQNQKDRNGNFILKEGMKTRMEILIGNQAIGAAPRGNQSQPRRMPR